MQDELLEVFSGHGEVVSVVIKRDRVTGNSLGYAFVQYKARLLISRKCCATR